LVKSFFVQTQERKCKVLDIIPYDINKKCSKIIAFVCLQMLSGVAMINVTIGGDEQVLCITKGMQTVDTNVSDEEGSRRNKGKMICRLYSSTID
jgi:hypothetical protein